MKTSHSTSNIFSSVIGFFLIIEGIWGLNKDVVFWILTTNTTHAVIHLLLGITSLVLAWAGYTRKFNLFLGALLTLVGVLRFVPGANQVIINLFNVNPAVAYLNIALGIIALVIVFGTRPKMNRSIN